MPIAEGNNWAYIYYNHSYETSDTSKMSIGEYREINGHGGYDIGSGLVKSDKDGNTIYVCAYNETDTIFPESVIYMKDIEKGDSFDYHMIVHSNSDGVETMKERTVVKKCINKDTLINTYAGDFVCTVLEHSPDDGDNIFRDYLSLNIGRVKSERFEDGFHFSTTELIAYEIK
jgi:hypothetical protein